MQDRSWMLNPQAIRVAKECVNIVKEELGFRLLLSHPDFMQLLHEYVELTDSKELADAYSRLIAMAGVGNVMRNLRPRHQKVVQFAREGQLAMQAMPAQEVEEEIVEYNGKQYPRYRGGKEFSGLYRGRPNYT